MKYKKIVSFICLTAIFSQNIPFDLLSYANEINKIEKMENIKEENDKIVSFICLTAIFSQNIPFDLLSYANEINKIEKMENIKEENDGNKEDKSSDTKVDTDKTTIKTEENKDTNVEEKKVSIGDYTFNAYIDGENELAFSLGFDTKEGK